MVHGPEVRDWCSAVHHDNEGSFAAEEVDQELEEGVEGKGFVDITERANPEGCLEGDETRP